jgi:hypothetical protein
VKTVDAIGLATQAIASGARSRVFDWDKAAALIREHKPKLAGAGLSSDWEWTGGDIYRDGQPVTDSYTYLSSRWATPELELDGVSFDCWKFRDETEWDSDTKWPASALAILNGEASS